MVASEERARLEALPLALGPALVAVLPRLARALTGAAPILPFSPEAPALRLSTPALPTPGLSTPGLRILDLPTPEQPGDLAVVVGTSGSTGTPKRALLSARALAASIGATHRTLGGPGQWLLALPPHHIAGLQVLLRGLVAGTRTVALDRPFTLADFCSATTLLDPDERHYTALVPTQLARLLDDPAGTEALRAFDAVLVGGAALPPRLRRRADEAGVVAVATYGMSETAGGCVYDGRPLPGTRVRLDDDGRIHLGGTTLAHGYLATSQPTPHQQPTNPADTDPADTDPFHTDADGIRWFRTDDHGVLLPDGRLHVDGRLDDLVNTGGLKVSPRLVEDAILTHCSEIAEVVVVGVPDPEWGQRVAALLVPAPTDPGGRAPHSPHPAPTLADLRSRLRGILPDHALPKQVATAPALPLRGPGKPDRAAIAALLSQS